MAKKPSITPAKNGPLILGNQSELTESTGREVETQRETVALCRCGQSKNKPYCDGTHGKVGFNDDKSEDRVPRHHDVYKGKTITIHDDRGICSHAGYCTGELPKVFKMGEAPWIDPDQASKDDIISTIRKCPSGALSYEVDGKRFTAYSDEAEVNLTEDGPYRVRGFIDLVSDDTPESKEHFALCRCGQSKNKPFCDGSHWYEGFKDPGKIKKSIFEHQASDTPYDNRYDPIRKLSRGKGIEHTAMRTLKTVPGFKDILFKASQLDRMPLNEDESVSLETTIGKTAKKPLKLSFPYYVSHMSFGAISKEAKIALAKGSTMAGTAMCSGEGGMLQESRDAAKTYIYEQGTASHTFNKDAMKQADAVEIKIGQGVKPGVGGFLPAHKVTPEIAKARGIEPYKASSAPGRLDGVNTASDLVKRVETIRTLIDGKPVGIKIATGELEKDLEVALKANPDFITIDCRGGATGAAPTFLKDNVGIPPVYAIRRARNYLDKKKSKISLCATGGFRDGADIAKGLAMGADAIALATASLISIGCLQSRVCHTGRCPVGIATQDETLRKMLDVDASAKGLFNFYSGIAEELSMLAKAHGKPHINKLSVEDLMTTSHDIASHTDIKHV
ncbi:MAG: glutamate synthase-related protein [Bacillota bacterium]